MEKENKPKTKRPQVNALYCSEEIADAVNNHPYFAGCFTGADKAAKLLQALNFAQNNEGKIPSNNSDLSLELENVKLELDNANKSISSWQDKYEKLEAEHSKADQEANEEIASLREANERLEASGNKKGWDVVRLQIDEAYANVLEEITKRLIERYKLPELEPQIVLVSFFMKYYYNQEWEFSGMPFVIKPSEILAIVQKVYPEMTSKVLNQALLVK